MENISGQCYCGGVTFRITAKKPLFSTYCHCIECRTAHAGPLYLTAGVHAVDFHIEKGEELLKDFYPLNHPLKLNRRFCATCGTRVYNTIIIGEGGWLPAGKYAGTFPALYKNGIPEAFKPTCHVYTSESVMDCSKITDGLPQYTHFPPPPEV